MTISPVTQAQVLSRWLRKAAASARARGHRTVAISAEAAEEMATLVQRLAGDDGGRGGELPPLGGAAV